MRLEKDEVRAAPCVRTSKEMIESDLEDFGRGGIAGDVPSKLPVCTIHTHHHCKGVPTHQRGYSLLELDIPRMTRLIRYGDCVSISGIGLRGSGQSQVLGVAAESPKKIQPPLASCELHDRG